MYNRWFRCMFSPNKSGKGGWVLKDRDNFSRVRSTMSVNYQYRNSFSYFQKERMPVQHVNRQRVLTLWVRSGADVPMTLNKLLKVSSVRNKMKPFRALVYRNLMIKILCWSDRVQMHRYLWTSCWRYAHYTIRLSCLETYNLRKLND